jgi:hypothetical protein
MVSIGSMTNWAPYLNLEKALILCIGECCCLRASPPGLKERALLGPFVARCCFQPPPGTHQQGNSHWARQTLSTTRQEAGPLQIFPKPFYRDLLV